jgi:site-specific recombinase XerD
MSHEPRLRDYLTCDEVSSLLCAAKNRPRHAARNYAMILIAYRHGLRASEVTGLRLSDLDLRTGTIYCRRAKGSRSSLHPMKPDEVIAVEKVLARRDLPASDYVFQSERSERMSRSAFWRIVSRLDSNRSQSPRTKARCSTAVTGLFGQPSGHCNDRVVEVMFYRVVP